MGRKKSLLTLNGRKTSSSQVSFKVGRPLRRSVSRYINFVSFTGRARTPKAGRKSYIVSSERKLWNTFYTNGRAVHLNGSTVFHKGCIVLYDIKCFNSDKSRMFMKESRSEAKEQHAEIKALTHIATKDGNCHVVREVNMLLSYSPCARCSAAIIHFKRSRPLLQISLAFSTLFRHKEHKHRLGLQHLNEESNIALRVFNENDWRMLALQSGVPFYNNDKRNKWDRYWDNELQQILNGAQTRVQKQQEVVLNLNTLDDSVVPLSRPATSKSSRKLECCVAIILILVLLAVILLVTCNMAT